YAAAQLVMVHAAGGGNHQFLGGIGAAVVLVDVLTGDGADTARGAADRAAQRVVTEDLCEEAFVHDLDRVVLAHRQFFEDDAAFTVELGLVHFGRGDHIDDHVGGDRQVGVEHPCEVARVLLAGGRIGLSPDGVEGGVDGQGVPGGGALEQQVLQEVGGAVVAVG